MGQHGGATHATDDADGVLRAEFLPVHVSGAVTAQVKVEGLPHTGHVSPFHHRQGNVGPPNGAVSGEVQHPLPFHGQAQAFEPLHHGLSPADSPLPEARQQMLKLLVLPVEEIAKDVDLRVSRLGAELNTWYQR